MICGICGERKGVGWGEVGVVFGCLCVDEKINVPNLFVYVIK